MADVINTAGGIDLFSLYMSFQSTVNTFIGGWFRPSTDFTKKANDISNELWNKWTAEAEKSQEARDNLIYFLQSKNIIVKSQNSYYGIITPPANYGRYASARIIVGQDEQTVPSKDVDGGKCEGFKTQAEMTDDYYDKIEEYPIENIDNQRWSSFVKHPTKGPTLSKPGLTQIDLGFKVAPRKISVVVLDYYVQPTDAKFIYTSTPGNTDTGAGDQLVYDSVKSTPLQWPNTMRDEFLVRLGEAYSYFTREQFWAQFNNEKKKTA